MAEDLTAEVFRHALAAIGGFEWRGVPFAAWLYRIAIAAGATSLYEPINQPYGDREAGVRDARGIEWFLATRLEGGPRQKAFGAEHVSGSMEHAEIRRMIPECSRMR